MPPVSLLPAPMNLLSALFTAVAPLFLLIVAGYALRRWARALHLAHVPILNGLVVNVTLPATIFVALTRAPHISAEYARLPLAMFLVEAALIGLIFVLARPLRLPRPTVGMTLFTGVFGNTVFLGYPVAQALLPQVFTGAVLIDQIGMMLPFFLCAPFVMERYGSGGTSAVRTRLARLARSPILLAVVSGLIAHYLRPFLPDTVHPVGAMALKAGGYLSQATTPLALLTLGVSLRPRAIASSARLLLPGALKLAVCPLLMWALCTALGLHGDMLRVGVLQASMPSSVTSSILSSQAEMDEMTAGGVVFATTLLSLVTIPVLQTLLH